MNTILLVALVILNALALYFWKPWLGAYGTEKAKNYARQEDLDKILSEVRAVTVATKEIEAKISGDLWSKQMVWNQRRDLYGNLLDLQNRLDGKVTDLICAHFGEVDEARISFIQDEILTTHREVLHLSSLAQIFASRRCCQAIKEMFTFGPKDLTGYASRLSSARTEIILAAREDLGLKGIK